MNMEHQVITKSIEAIIVLFDCPGCGKEFSLTLWHDNKVNGKTVECICGAKYIVRPPASVYT
jgi:transcription elongation factor Elf1